MEIHVVGARLAQRVLALEIIFRLGEVGKKFFGR